MAENNRALDPIIYAMTTISYEELKQGVLFSGMNDNLNKSVI